MSKIQRDKFNKIWNMPSWKIMGAVSDNTIQNIKKLVVKKDSSANEKIFHELEGLLNTNVYDISADLYSKMFDSGWQRSKNFDTPTGVFILSAMGDFDVEILGEDKTLSVPIGKVAFVDERLQYRIFSNTNGNTIIMSGRFLWNSHLHSGN